MKILQIHNFYQQPGGEEAVLQDEKLLLESHGQVVLRYTRHNDEIQQMSLPRVVRQTFWSPRTYREVRELLRRERPDVVHCANLLHLVSPSAYYAAQAEGVPVVQTLHNFRMMCPNSTFARNERACEDCLGKWFAWPAIQHACYRNNRVATTVLTSMIAYHRIRRTWTDAIDWYIVLSDFSRQKFVEGGIDNARITVKPNFVFPEPQPGTGGGKFAVFVGRLSPEKGITTLLDAWQSLTEPIPLKIIGDGPLGNQVGEAASRDSRIEWLGRQPLAEVYDQIRDATCLILPSVCYENCPKTVIEAFALGTPVVASHTGALVEMIDDGTTGLLFEAGDGTALAAQVQRMFGSRGERLRMGAAARSEFERRYSAEANYRALMDVYQQAIQFKRSAANSSPSALVH
jgi:glycosyltransferase involved in cell wall biosynthesis